MFYPEVKKFNGLKLMVFEKATWAKVDELRIDPHFYDDDLGPCARFKPDESGVNAALNAIVNDDTLHPGIKSLFMTAILKIRRSL